MKFLIVGALGRMGREVIAAAKEGGDEIVGLDIKSAKLGDILVYGDVSKLPKNVDAIIDFSTATDRRKLIDFAVKNKIAYGLFSTAISKDDEKQFKKASKNISILMCQNASVGVNLLYKMTDFLSKNMKAADVVLTEYHHKQKKDISSGTAKNIEKILTENGINFTTGAYRVANEKGYHKVEFFMGDEIVTISHRANSRKIFAVGAVKAVKKLKNKPNGQYFDILDL